MEVNPRNRKKKKTCSLEEKHNTGQLQVCIKRRRAHRVVLFSVIIENRLYNEPCK
jgi:hypothetical protein